MVKLIGYVDGEAKSGNKYTMAYVVSDLSNNDIARGTVGQKAETVFLPVVQVGTLTPDDIGKEVQLDYTVSGGRAYLESFNVIRKK